MKMINVSTMRPFTRCLMTIGQLPTSYLVSMTYEEQLLWLCDYLEKEVIPALNNNAEALKEVQDLYVALKKYVDDYFSNLDVQEEINNKLDDMATDGTLARIINEEIFNQLNTRIDTIEETMTNKLGYYVTPQMFGAIGDASHDDTQAFQDAIDYIKTSGKKMTLFVPYGFYKITDTLVVDFDEFSMTGIPRTEFMGRIIANGAEVQNGFIMMEIKGYGAVLQNIEFREYNIQNNAPKSTGVTFFRNTGSSVADNANVDCDVTSCQFFDLAIGIRGAGRNFDITECDFIRDEVGIKIDYNSEMEMRDVNVFHCRFHAIGQWSERANTSTCIQMPETPNHTMQKVFSITQNFADFIGSFIKGSGHGLIIQGNQLWDVKNTAIDLIGDNVITALRQPLVIKENVITGARLSPALTSGSPVMYHAIKLENLRNSDVCSNSISNSYKEPMVFNNCNGLNILNNSLLESPINPELMGLTVPTYSYLKFDGGTNINVNGNSATPAYLSDNTTVSAAYVISKTSGSIRVGANNMNKAVRFNEYNDFDTYSSFDNTSSHT